jgi:hypothetical protein
MAKKEAKKATKKAKTTRKVKSKRDAQSTAAVDRGCLDALYPPFNYKTIGRPLNYTPEELLDEFVNYLNWAKANPIEAVFQTSGTSYTGDSFGNTNKKIIPRLISISGFLVHLGETESWWKNLEDGKRGEDFLKVKSKIKNYCETYQKEMASAGLFKENIVSRMLGLKDKQEVEQKGEGWKIIVNSEEEKRMVEGLKDLDI